MAARAAPRPFARRHADHVRLAPLVHGQIIVIDGIVGAGKSTYIAALAAALREVGFHVVVLTEPVGPRLLDYFGSDPVAHAAFMQQTMLLKRQLTMVRAEHLAAVGGAVVLVDRGLSGDVAFFLKGRADGLISDAAAAVYEEQLASESFLAPRLTLFLHCSNERAKANIRERASNDADRALEVAAYLEKDPTYIDRLAAVYEQQMEAEQVGGPVARLEWSEATRAWLEPAALRQQLYGALVCA